MQTFLPYPDLHRSAAVLDYRRLGKQRVEAYQIIRAALNLSKGWGHHPATRMWANNLAGLAAYGVTCCDRWVGLGYKDTTRDKITALVTPDAGDLPGWFGLEGLHLSHQSALVRKDPSFYSVVFPGVPADLGYVWPVVTQETRRG
jgi:hypothetical protein